MKDESDFINDTARVVLYIPALFLFPGPYSSQLQDNKVQCFFFLTSVAQDETHLL